jgi:hypothetical protein
LREKFKGKIMANYNDNPAFEAWSIGEYCSNSLEFSTKDNARNELKFLWVRLAKTTTVKEYDDVMYRISIISSLLI